MQAISLVYFLHLSAEAIPIIVKHGVVFHDITSTDHHKTPATDIFYV